MTNTHRNVCNAARRPEVTQVYIQPMSSFLPPEQLHLLELSEELKLWHYQMLNNSFRKKRETYSQAKRDVPRFLFIHLRHKRYIKNILTAGSTTWKKHRNAHRLIIKSPSQIKRHHIHQTGVNQAAKLWLWIMGKENLTAEPGLAEPLNPSFIIW